MNGGLHQPAHLQQFMIQFFEFDGEMTHLSPSPFRHGRIAIGDSRKIV
jgi:hypothetical protein